MPLPHDAEVLVIDGRKLLFLRNHGDATRIDLRTESHEEREDAKDREIKSDAAGAGSNSSFVGRPAFDETDFHQQDEDRFAHHAADLLKQRTLAGDHHPLAIVAAPRTLGELRKRLHKEVEKRIVMTLSKDMTNRPIPDIEKLIEGEGVSTAG